jgi:signal transduction histidine kinase
LRQILINLTGNAIKFTELGHVRVVTRFMDDLATPMLQFDILDTGRGMTADEQAALFRSFSQADNSISRKFGGTGLGLTISRRFAELLGGDVTIASSTLGGDNFQGCHQDWSCCWRSYVGRSLARHGG